MALRNIRTIGDEILRKEAKSVKAMTPRTEKLIEDMLDTMYDAYGVGLAAPQVGILKRIVVIDVSENQDEPYVLINPEIIETSGSQTGSEGCLSVPGKHATVTRPDYAKVRAQDENRERAFWQERSAMNVTIWMASSMWTRRKVLCWTTRNRRKRRSKAFPYPSLKNNYKNNLSVRKEKCHL